MEPTALKLSELADAADVSPRTVRYYIALGLLSSPGRLGPSTRYSRAHLDRLRLIKQLREQGLSLAEIRQHLERAPMATDASSSSAVARSGTPLLEEARDARPGRALWERIVLSPDVELHVRKPASRPHRTKVAHLIDTARGILRTGGLDHE